VLGRGRVIADAPVATIEAMATGTAVHVRTPDGDHFAELLAKAGGAVTYPEPDLLVVTGLTAPQIGELAARERVVLHELSPVGGSLEDAYLALTQDEVEYHAGGTVSE
ncbi:MAG: ABC transporter ATP-binding protein, partial [Leifsonia sp.]